MTSYYEDLGISPDVSVEVIQTAIDTRYNQWRELTTHPDAEMRAEAERNQRLLEQMRTTLTDPTRRAAYDAGIGLSGLGGLADPAAVLQRAAPPPPRPKKGAAKPGDEAGGSGLWTCPKCATDNPPQTNHCFKCGTQLVRACPACGQMASLIATGFCGNCGARYEIAVNMKKVEEQQIATANKLSQTQGELASTQIELQGLKEPSLPRGRVIAAVLALLLGLPWLFLGLLEGDGTGLVCGAIVILPAFFYLIYSFNKRSSTKTEYINKRQNASSHIALLEQQLQDTQNLAFTLEAEHQKLEKQLRQRG